MDSRSTILIVEDEPAPRLLLRQVLCMADFEVIEATSGVTALALAAEQRPAVIVMDVSMPGLSGFAVVRQLRATGDMTPVLLLTCYGNVEDRVQGLGAGADDYLVKPYDPRELLARVRALLRRAAGPGAVGLVPPKREPRVLHLGRAVIDLEVKRAEQDGVRVPLTKTEFAMLECLAAAQGRPVSREELLRAVWGYEADTHTRTVETHVWRLRKKIGDTGDLPGTIETRSGLGYTLSPGAWAAAAAPLAVALAS